MTNISNRAWNGLQAINLVAAVLGTFLALSGMASFGAHVAPPLLCYYLVRTRDRHHGINSPGVKIGFTAGWIVIANVTTFMQGFPIPAQTDLQPGAYFITVMSIAHVVSHLYTAVTLLLTLVHVCCRDGHDRSTDV